MLRRFFASILLCAVVCTYTIAVEAASSGAGGLTLNSAGNHPALCHTGRSDGRLLQSTGVRRGPALAGDGLPAVLAGTVVSAPVVDWIVSDADLPGSVLHGRLAGGHRSARGPPRHDL